MSIDRPRRSLVAAARRGSRRRAITLRRRCARATALALGLATLAHAGAAAAGPKEWYAEGLGQCEKLAFSSSSFDWETCGVDAGCAGSDCHWGTIRVNGASAAERGAPDRPKGPQPLVPGGVFDATSGKVLGLSIPVSRSHVFRSRDALDLAGSIQVGKGDGH